jgi:hypothetical protein
MKTFIIKSATALILISFISASAGANQIGKKHSKRIADAELFYLTENVAEQKLTIEKWMTDVDYFRFSPINDLREAEIQLSGWMYDPDYFYHLNPYGETENVIDLEAWMADPEYFYPPAKIISGK